MKLRIVVWALVGLVVIAGSIFLVATSGKRPVARRTVESCRAQAERTMKQLDRLTLRAEAVRTSTPTTPELEQRLAEVARLVSEARAKAEQVCSSSDTKQAVQLLREAKTLMNGARRALDLAAGPRRPTGN